MTTIPETITIHGVVHRVVASLADWVDDRRDGEALVGMIRARVGRACLRGAPSGDFVTLCPPLWMQHPRLRRGSRLAASTCQEMAP